MRATRFRKVVRAVEKLMEFAVEKVCLAKYSKKLGLLTKNQLFTIFSQIRIYISKFYRLFYILLYFAIL